MKPTLIFLFLLCTTFSFSQVKEGYESKPNLVFKIAPRVLSPRLGIEKVLNQNSTFGVDIRAYTFWLPSGVRPEFYYRYYFKNAPFGGYIQPKLAIGYFDFGLVDEDLNGIGIGTGIVGGAQIRLGNSNGVVDLFGGFQFIPPIYFQSSSSISIEANTAYYLLMAFPLELGIRFGGFSQKVKPSSMEWMESDF